MSNNIDDTFEKLYQAEEEDIDYYRNAAMQYLSDVEDLKDQLTECYERVKNNRMMHIILKEQQEASERKIANLQTELEKRRTGSDETVDPIDLENRVRAFTNQIKADIERFNRTGQFDNIDNSINETRDLFNVFLAELNNLNANNRDVVGALETLVRLDNCEKLLRRTKRELRERPNPAIVISQH